ncbi:hypothetical protein C8R45DRAFT_940940 [Mycena sanguinolenta]|nr:hypothetical protein C8R45DRAFT_940940 [Mycena sanguinolenta]
MWKLRIFLLALLLVALADTSLLLLTPLSVAKEPPGPGCIPIQQFPRELHGLIPAGLDIRDLCTLTRTSALFRRECHLVFRASLERAFAEFDLDADAVRFILTQANAILAGWFIYHLSRMDFVKLQAVKTIDLYVRKGAGAKLISRFVQIATVYKQMPINESLTSFFIAYPEFTLDARAMVSHPFDRQEIDVDVYWVLGAIDCGCVERTGVEFDAVEVLKLKRKHKNGDFVVAPSASSLLTSA